MHFCADELMMLMASIPFLAVLSRKFHAWRHRRKCPHASEAK